MEGIILCLHIKTFTSGAKIGTRQIVPRNQLNRGEINLERNFESQI
jgi:hypothetical protein